MSARPWWSQRRTPTGVDTPARASRTAVDTRPRASTRHTPAVVDTSGPSYAICDHCGHYLQVVQGPGGLWICAACRRRFHRADPAALAATVQDAEVRLAAVQQAISAVDAKTALAATVQAAALALTDPTAGGWPGRLSTVLLLVALALSGAVITPRLTRGRVADAADAVWFGQLRAWTDPELLAARLHHLSVRPELRLLGLARQLQTTSQIAWRKHQTLRGSLIATGAAVALHALSRLT